MSHLDEFVLGFMELAALLRRPASVADFFKPQQQENQYDDQVDQVECGKSSQTLQASLYYVRSTCPVSCSELQPSFAESFRYLIFFHCHSLCHNKFF